VFGLIVGGVHPLINPNLTLTQTQTQTQKPKNPKTQRNQVPNSNPNTQKYLGFKNNPKNCIH